jgi:hypothetical protein
MGQIVTILKPVGGINVDAAEEYVKPTEVRYALNMERIVNNSDNGMGKNSQISTPVAANVILEYQQPDGVNTTIGRCVSKKTNEIYVFVHNSLTHHHIYRINGRNNTTEMVLLDPLLGFKINPRHQIRFRAHLFFNDQKVLNGLHRKYLAWTEGSTWQGFLDVETSIATNGFRTAYYFCYDRTQLWTLPVRPSLKCIQGDFEVNNNPEMANRIARQMWLFRIQFIYTDGRPSAWSPVSDGFVNLMACRDEDVLEPRCINLRIDAGGPHVEKIVLAYGNCLGNFTEDQMPQFFQTDILNKYEDCLGSDDKFYQRKINQNLKYDAATNTFLYKFCNEKTCMPVSKAETDLNFIPVPKTSYALMPQEDKLALLNNEWGDDPIDCRVMQQLRFTDEQVVSLSEVRKTVTIKVAIVVHQMFRSNNVPIFVYEDIGTNKPEDTEGKIKYFGGLSKKQGTFFGGNHPFDDPGPYEQYFADTSKDAGFIIYVEGGDAFGVTKQYRTDGVNDGQPFIEENFNDTDHRNDVSDALYGNGYYFIQIAEIKVPKGSRGFLRVASPLAKVTDDFRKTSANVFGILNGLGAIGGGYGGNFNVHQGNCNTLQKEIYFDTCDATGMTGDVFDLTNFPFVIADLTGPYVSVDIPSLKSVALTGYVTDTAGKPVANAAVGPYFITHAAISSIITDFNGYYFASLTYGGADQTRGVNIFIEGPGPGAADCQQRNGGFYEIPGDSAKQVFHGDIIVGDKEYETNYLQPVRVKVINSAGRPLSGVTIAASTTKSQITNSDGEAVFNFRQMFGSGVQFGALQVRFIVMQKAGCVLITQDQCEPTLVQLLPICFRSPSEIRVDTFTGIEQVAGEAGYHPGGVYPMAIKLMDAAGRETFAEKAGLVHCREMQATGQFGLFRIKWDILGPMNLPREYVKMAILIGRNTAFDDFVTWIADNVRYVDSSGITSSPLNASKIVIDIQSIYDTAVFYGFGTNVRYGFVPGDRVQIITDKNGRLYSKIFEYQVESAFNNRDLELKEGESRYSTIVIPFDKGLVDFEAGAKIKLIRPVKCKPQDLYFETCDLIDLKDGEPVVKTGYVGGYDTYMVRRTIRYDNMGHVFGFPFLHHSPSDFWGDHCVPRGRVSVANPYSRRIRYERNIKISASFLQNGLFNGLAWYDDKLQKNFSGEQRGAIIAGISLEKIFLCICEYDNFLAQTADEFVRIDARTGQAVALSGDQVVSDAESKIVGDYGCQYDDVGSIESGNGWVFWIDTFRKAPVLHDWSVAKDVSIDKMQGYFGPKLTHIYKNNISAAEQNKIRIVSGYDCISGNVLITFFDPAKSYAHSRHEFALTENETIAFSVLDGTFPTAYGFTPENYCSYENSVLGSLFIAFKNGKPWLHRILNLGKFDTFFGVGSDQVFEPIINERPDKVKIMVAMQQLTAHPYFIDKLVTSNGHESILPPAWVKKKTEGKFDAEFLQAMNKKGGLFNGPMLRGHWVQVRFVRENSINNIPNTVDIKKQEKYSELDMILVKCTISEQSAYNT